MLFVVVLFKVSLPVVPLVVVLDVLLAVAFEVVLPVIEALDEGLPDPEKEALPDETETLVRYLAMSYVTIIIELL